MKISKNGIELIKRYEGCRLYSYKPIHTEKYWTIGYGHYGSDVRENMIITQKQADDMLINDIVKVEKYVNATGLNLNQNQFDALVSFTYNCGQGNLKKLVSGRSISQISNALLLYDKAGGKSISGLAKRRKSEKEMYDNGIYSTVINNNKEHYTMLKSLKKGDKGKTVKIWQLIIDVKLDGIFGPICDKETKIWQSTHDLKSDGIVGPKTWEKAIKNID